MSNNVQEAIISKKIEGVIYDIFPQTKAGLVITDDGKTVATVLGELATAIAGKATSADIDSRINALVNGAPETYDTLKEIADYISDHEDVVTALNAAIGDKVDKVTGKGLSTEDFTTALKQKLEAITVDSALSGTSENAVQNKVVKGALDLKANSADLATVATSGSYADLTNKPTIDNTLDTTSTNAIQNSAVATALNAKGRIIVSTTEPVGLTENDLWLQPLSNN